MTHAKVIRDPIHGNIQLSDLEVKLLDTREMQRLRHIRQNGLCYIVYPSMNSTRFEHSLGVMHLAGLAANHLDLNDDDTAMVRAAGLLHDVGHGPFSHTTDSIFERDGLTHETNSSKIIRETVIADILGDAGFNADEVADLVLEKGRLSSIISSEIDVDKMDYLIRDSHYAGVAYGFIDLERLIYSLKLVGNDLVVKEGSLEAVEFLLISRNMMYQTVYRHHAKRIAESMLVHAIQYLIDCNELTLDQLLAMDDIDLIHTLRESGGYPGEIMERLDQRRLFKKFFQERIVDVTDAFLEDLRVNDRSIERKISGDYSIPGGYLLLDIPETKLLEYKISVEIDGELKTIDEVSSLARTLEESEQEKLYLNMYVAPEYLKKLEDFNPEPYIEYRQTRLQRYT